MLLKYSMFHATRLRFLTSPYHINTNGLLWSRRQWYALSRFPERNPGVSRHRCRINSFLRVYLQIASFQLEYPWKLLLRRILHRIRSIPVMLRPMIRTVYEDYYFDQILWWSRGMVLNGSPSSINDADRSKCWMFSLGLSSQTNIQ